MKRYYSRWIEKNSWLLILVVVIPGFLFNDSNYKVAIYSYLVIIFPILLYWSFNPHVLQEMAKLRSVQLFAAFFIYTVASILWSANEQSVKQMLVRCLGACVLLTLCYLVTRYQANKLPRIENIFLLGGTACLILAIYKKGFRLSVDRFQDSFGPFSHHVYASWLAAALLLLLLARAKRLSMLQCVLFCFFLGYIMLSAGRGGLLVFVAGYLCMIFSQETRFREKQVILCFIIPAVFIAALNPNALLNMINKGGSSRGAIFQLHFNKATDTSKHIVIGRGVNTSTDIQIKQAKIPHFHSLYLTLMYNGGVIGLLLYLIMVTHIFIQSVRSAHPPPWLYVAIGMSAALAVDASDFFVWPSALMTCFIIPLFFTLFSATSQSGSDDKINSTTVR